MPENLVLLRKQHLSRISKIDFQNNKHVKNVLVK